MSVFCPAMNNAQGCNVTPWNSFKKYIVCPSVAIIGAFASYKLYQRHQGLNQELIKINNDLKTLNFIEYIINSSKKLSVSDINSINNLFIILGEPVKELTDLADIISKYNDYPANSDNGCNLIKYLKEKHAARVKKNRIAKWQPITVPVGLTAVFTISGLLAGGITYGTLKLMADPNFGWLAKAVLLPGSLQHIKLR